MNRLKTKLGDAWLSSAKTGPKPLGTVVKLPRSLFNLIEEYQVLMRDTHSTKQGKAAILLQMAAHGLPALKNEIEMLKQQQHETETTDSQQH